MCGQLSKSGALKDRAMEQRFDRVTSKTGVQWKYLKVMQTVFPDFDRKLAFFSF
jgi:hypothetical protein